ncbi:ATP-binding cassette domain-containing protein, partial [Acinetobacter baumannii]|nr:ATP-binding cassette domain-containing protein [Acinetobacter baumannii]
AYTVQSRGEQLLLGLGFSLAQMNQPVASFSGGWRMRLNLAQALMCPSDLLLLDEPLSALDLNYQLHVMDLVRRETRRRNIVTLVVVHDINIALRHADHVLMLKAGQLLG